MTYDQNKRLAELQNKLKWLNQQIAVSSKGRRADLMQRRENVNHMIHQLKTALGYAMR